MTVSINTINLFFAIVVLMFADTITGLLNAWVLKDLNSTKMKSGITTKVGIFAMITVSFILTLATESELIVDSTIVFYIIEEILSIIENTSSYIKYPKILTDSLSKLSNKISESEVK